MADHPVVDVEEVVTGGDAEEVVTGGDAGAAGEEAEKEDDVAEARVKDSQSNEHNKLILKKILY